MAPRKYIHWSQLEIIGLRAMCEEDSLLREYLLKTPNPNNTTQWSSVQQWAFMQGMEYMLHRLHTNKNYPCFDLTKKFPSHDFKLSRVTRVASRKLSP